MKTRYTFIALAALLTLSGCSTPSQLRAQYDVDCNQKSDGDQKAFDTCYSQSKNAIRQRMNFVNPLGAAELAQILEKLDAQKAAFKPKPKPKQLTGEEYQKLVVAELNKRLNDEQAIYSGQACDVLMSINADGTINEIEGTPALPRAQAAAASVAMADASIDAALANGPCSDENAATPIAPPEIQQQQNGGSLCAAFINTAKASPLPKPPLANGESSFPVSFTYEDDAKPQS